MYINLNNLTLNAEEIYTLFYYIMMLSLNDLFLVGGKQIVGTSVSGPLRPVTNHGQLQLEVF